MRRQTRAEQAGGCEAGYNLVALMVAITVLNVLLAAVLPLLSTQVQREKEEELIARGLQYAEAIRIFKTRFGRAPVRLEELIEVEPRSIRQLWEDPMTEGGKWELIIEGQPGRQLAGGDGADPEGRQPGAQAPSVGGPGPDGEGERVVIGPISGVRSRSQDEALKEFFGATRYSEWRFTDVIFTGAPAAQAGQQATTTAQMPARWLGRSFPFDLSPAMPQPPPQRRPGARPGRGRPGQRQPGRPGQIQPGQQVDEEGRTPADRGRDLIRRPARGEQVRPPSGQELTRPPGNDDGPR